MNQTIEYKAAILFVGRVNFYKSTYSLFFKNLINNNKNILFDIYIATWELPESEKKDLIDIYNPKQLLEYKLTDYQHFLEENAEFVLKMKRKKINTDCYIHNFKPSGIDVFLFQYFFILEGLQKIKKTNYDIIIKNRFDVLIEVPFVIIPILPRKVFSPRFCDYGIGKGYILPKNGYKHWIIHDPLFYGTTDSMLKLLYLLPGLPGKIKLLGGPRPESLITCNFITNGIKTKPNLDLKIKIIRSHIEPESEPELDPTYFKYW